MDSPSFVLIVAATLLAAVALVAMVSLRGFTAWLDLKRAELDAARGSAAPVTTGARIELADLKERIKKLEAIAAGVDL